MENEAPDRRKQRYSLRRSILDYGMGLIIIGVGVYLLLGPYLGAKFAVDGFIRFGFGSLCLLYGGWRAYRGYKKNYFD